MPRSLIRAAAVALLGIVAACNTPVSPDRGPKNTDGQPTHLGFRYWDQDAATQTMIVRAWGTWGVLYTLSRDVSDEAAWTSSNPAVARVAAPGIIQSVGFGDTTITVTFRSLSISQRLHVFAGAPQTKVLETAIGKVRDSSVQSGEDGLPGVTVEVLTGYNAGRTAVTVERGMFSFNGDFYCGHSVIRLSKAGYREVVRDYTWCNDVPQPGLVMAPG